MKECYKDIDKLKKALDKAGAKPLHFKSGEGCIVPHISPKVTRKIVLFAIRSGMNLNTGEFCKTDIYNKQLIRITS